MANRDFTVKIYKNLLASFISAGYSFQTYRDFTTQPKEKTIILRRLREGEGVTVRLGGSGFEKERVGEWERE